MSTHSLNRYSLACAAVWLVAGCSWQTPVPELQASAVSAAKHVVTEAFVSELTPQDNIDSVASWRLADGTTWVLATAKATDRLVIYDGESGQRERTVGERGEGAGQYQRPNGIAVVDDFAFIVERDNRRVQMLKLPELTHVTSFGADVLTLPYGLWVTRREGGYTVYVTDAYMAGEDAQGEDILPPIAELNRRVKRFEIEAQADVFEARLAAAFGDTSEQGALRVVESLWGDTEHDRLLIAEEDETYANEFKVYGLDGRFTGRTIGGDVLRAQSEGIALKRCAEDAGWWIATEQGKERSTFHLFDRKSLDHVGAFVGAAVSNTDGIWLDDGPMPRFPKGALYVVHDDQGVAAFDWRDIAHALGLPECVSIDR